MVMTELERNLGRRGLDEKQITHRVAQMNGAFPDALVTGYEALIGDMTNDPKDRHVLAAAVRSGAEALVTENLRDSRQKRSARTTSTWSARTPSCSTSSTCAQPM
jgi:predicted nucleic acid-binding protein